MPCGIISQWVTITYILACCVFLYLFCILYFPYFLLSFVVIVNHEEVAAFQSLD